MSVDRHTTIIDVDVTAAISAEVKLQNATQDRIAATRQLAALQDEAERSRIRLLLQSEDVTKRATGYRREEARAARQAIATAREEEAAIRGIAAQERARADAHRAAADASARSFTSVGAQIGNVITGFQSLIGIGKQAVAVIDGLAKDSMMAQNVSANLQIPIDGARQAFKGYVDDVELARIANMAFELGVVETGDELTALASGVQAKAEKLGVSSTELFDNAVVAIGRQSKLILDNLGIILDQGKAEQIYAESLGKTVKQLTAYQKSQAFAKAATLEIAKAGKEATSATDGLAQSYQRATVMITNFRSSMLGFDDSAGRTREALRKLTDDELKSITQTETYGAAVDEADAALGRYGLTLENVKALGDPVTLAQAEQQRRVAEGLEFEQKQIEENNQVRAKGLQGWAKDTEHQIALQGILGTEESALIQMKIEALELEKEASIILGAKTDEDRARTHEIEKQIELERARLGMAQLEEEKKKRGSGRRDPNAALDRETKATLELLDARQEIYAAELEGERNLESAANTRRYLTSLEREALDVREDAANQRKVRGADQIAERESELLAIRTERRLLDVEAQKLEREESQRIAEERLAAMDREIETLGALGVATTLLERTRADARIAFAEQFSTTQEIIDVKHDEHLAAIERVKEREAELEKRRQEQQKRELARIADRKEKFQRAQQATNSLIGASVGLAEAVANATMRNEAKRERFVLRVRGVEAVARGAAETVEAVAAYASLNIPQGVLHTIAAATAFATGIPMIAGVVPSKGGATTAAPGAGGDGGSQAISSTYERGGDYKSPVVPPSAEELMRLRNGPVTTTQTTASKQGGGTVINIQNFVAGDAGTILQDMEKKTAKQWGSR